MPHLSGHWKFPIKKKKKKKGKILNRPKTGGNTGSSNEAIQHQECTSEIHIKKEECIKNNKKYTKV